MMLRMVSLSALTAALCAPLGLAQATDLGKRVDAYLAPLVEMGIFSGTVLVARDGEVLVHRAYGDAETATETPNTTDTRFKIMSVSKAITAVAALRLVQDGALELTDPVGDHLPDWPIAWRAVTVHDLLDHSSGIPDLIREFYAAYNRGERGLAAWKSTAAKLQDAALTAAPGTRHRYSNLQFELLGAVLESVTGETYQGLMRERLLTPAGMEATGFDDGSRPAGLAMGYFRKRGVLDPSYQDMSRIQAAGGFYSTTHDLYRLDRALHTDAVLSSATQSIMTTPRTGNYACGWRVDPLHGHDCVRHSGGSSGFVANLLRFPADDACVVMMSNFAFAPITRLSEDIAGLLFDAEIESPRVATESELSAAAGVYGSGAQLAVVRRSGDTLLLFELDPRSRPRCGGRLLLPLASGGFATPFGRGSIEIDAEGLSIPRGDSVQKLPRLPSADAAWTALAGEYTATRADGARQQSAVRISVAAGALELRTGADRSFLLAPVTEHVAIALYADAGGTLVYREPAGLRWHGVDGVDSILQR